ncbi:MAG: nitrite/sulfite reductase [Chlamydiae bacterium]|nr:nitrite/sulfite reductase [Chlamydiota bacterium]MBI3265682.1 nitrite/sulfite reductase [Chlamydiota bacterium]
MSGALKKELPPEVEAEIQRFEREIALLQSGQSLPEDFQRFRLENGIYGIRGFPELHMIRVKIPYGNLTAEQTEVLADIADKYTPGKVGHVTTRQNVQYHYVKRPDVPVIMRRLAECGLTTREACGNTVRTVTACPYSGISAREVFDVAPYANLISQYLLRNPLNQTMPRKFKIAFEGCPEDHARVPIHDLGFVAKMKGVNGKNVKGFQVYIGGGLGATPRSPMLLEEFTPEELFIPTVEAVIRTYDRHGNRKDRARARIKFLVKDWGEEEFRKRILDERKTAYLTQSGKALLAKAQIYEEKAPEVEIPKGYPILTTVESAGYERWRSTNIFKQKQAGFVGVIIRCPLGDITVPQLRKAAQIARKYCGGRLRILISQNIILRWIPEKVLPWVYKELSDAGIGLHSAERVADITRCPGADTCQIAITHSRGLAANLTPLFNNGLGSEEALQDVKIKISGCFNSCGQHHIADIGFYGMGKRVGDREVPHYQMLLGGGTQEGLAYFGSAIAMIPAKRVKEAVDKILKFFLAQKNPNESFKDFIKRQGIPKFKEMVQEFQQIPAFDVAPEYYEDLGDEGKAFKMEVGKGECAV